MWSRVADIGIGYSPNLLASKLIKFLRRSVRRLGRLGEPAGEYSALNKDFQMDDLLDFASASS